MKKSKSDEYINKNKVVSDIATTLNIPVEDCNKVLDSYYFNIANIIREDKPISIIMPYLGKIQTNSQHLKIYAERTQTNNDQ